MKKNKPKNSSFTIITSGNKNLNAREHVLQYLRKAMPSVRYTYLNDDGSLRKNVSILSKPGGQAIEVIAGPDAW